MGDLIIKIFMPFIVFWKTIKNARWIVDKKNSWAGALS